MIQELNESGLISFECLLLYVCSCLAKQRNYPGQCVYICIGSKIYVTPFVSNSVNWLSKLFGVHYVDHVTL